MGRDARVRQEETQAQVSGAGAPSRPLWLLAQVALRQEGVLARALVYAGQVQALPRRVRRWLRRTLAVSVAELALLLALARRPGRRRRSP